MEAIRIEKFSFKYPQGESMALKNLNIEIPMGEFVTVCGRSGCGKTTLLRCLKPELAPFGEKSGKIVFKGENIDEIPKRETAGGIGFVLQDPESQVVTDKVYHELAFGLENLGVQSGEIRARVAEAASFFGIEDWFHKKVAELSGGQKQLLNLASVMVMNPDVLVLDEPTSQLDPIAAEGFIHALKKINMELGTTIIISEHRLEEVFGISDKVIVLDEGEVFAQGTPREVAAQLTQANHPMKKALPTSMRIYGMVDEGKDFPLTAASGKNWLRKYSKAHQVRPWVERKEETPKNMPAAVCLEDVHFGYDKNLDYVLSGLSCKIYKGEIYAILGGNGVGKTTLASLISGNVKANRGRVTQEGGRIGVLPQNPEVLFLKKTVGEDLFDVLNDSLTMEERNAKVKDMADLCGILQVLHRHPYDLSGGEKQRTALAKVLLLDPDIIILDEPTKGFDAHFKEEFAEILKMLKKWGKTIIMVSHDVEFCAHTADRCALLFDGRIVSEDTPDKFFTNKNFYTTAAHRISKGIIKDAVLAKDVAECCGKTVHETPCEIHMPKREIVQSGVMAEETPKPKTSLTSIFTGIMFFAAFLLVHVFFGDRFTDWKGSLISGIEIILCGCGLYGILPQRQKKDEELLAENKKQKLSKRSKLAVLITLTAIPITVLAGMYLFKDRSYYLISVLVILETMLPFFFAFEGRKPKARELVIISILCAIAIAGRNIFYMLPQFKPALAVVIISGIAFGGEAGFLVGAIYAFASNFFFGQGPWTPWQMLATGMVGFVGGIIFHKGLLRKTKANISIFGAASIVIIYGGILNPASAIMFQPQPTWDIIISSCVAGLPFDLVHATSTAFFLWFMGEIMLDKLDRVKKKYGILR